jgi:hypothetical protein
MDMILQIVDIVKTAIRAQEIICLQKGITYSPWSETANGAGWLDNEVCLFNDLYAICHPYYEIVDLCHCATVQECIDTLYNANTSEYITLLFAYVKNGGTANSTHFSLRNLNKDTVLAYFRFIS